MLYEDDHHLVNGIRLLYVLPRRRLRSLVFGTRCGWGQVRIISTKRHFIDSVHYIFFSQPGPPVYQKCLGDLIFCSALTPNAVRLLSLLRFLDCLCTYI